MNIAPGPVSVLPYIMHFTAVSDCLEYSIYSMGTPNFLHMKLKKVDRIDVRRENMFARRQKSKAEKMKTTNPTSKSATHATISKDGIR